jgi:hypothetical protein
MPGKRHDILPDFSFKIERHFIPPPPDDPGGRPRLYIFEAMQVRESAVINRSYQSVSRALFFWKKRTPENGRTRFRIKTLVRGKSCRIWRLPDVPNPDEPLA